jgi:hypothetical protein
MRSRYAFKISINIPSPQIAYQRLKKHSLLVDLSVKESQMQIVFLANVVIRR